MEVVAEVLEQGATPIWRNPVWSKRFPWLIQGITGTGADGGFDLGLFGDQPVGAAMQRWRELIDHAGLPGAVHSRQVHGGEIYLHQQVGWKGLLVMNGFDGHVAAIPGLMLTVSIADCVPVAIIDAESRVVSLVHAGWRGVAAGIAEKAVEMLVDLGSRRESLHAHSGPSICGDCYEVGPEVHRAVNGTETVPENSAPIDLRASLSERVVGRGVPGENVTISAHCTRCGPGSFFSHRGGSSARQMSILGRRY
ncbi:hypothetical protein BH23GEM6_BH23GEM6_20360 [soil metagenome]